MHLGQFLFIELFLAQNIFHLLVAMKSALDRFVLFQTLILFYIKAVPPYYQYNLLEIKND